MWGLPITFELSSDDGRPTGGERPAALLEPWPQGKTERHDGIAYELVQALDAPVLQMVEQLPNVVQFFATQLPVVADPVIEVPKILPHDVPPRRLCRDTQLAEQLAEVSTTLYFLKQRIPKQIVDNPVPHGGRGASGGLQGFLPGHVEQTVDFPAPCSCVRRLQGFLPEQSSSSSSHDPARVAEALDEPGEWVFRTFPKIKKKCETGSALESESARQCQLIHASSSSPYSSLGVGHDPHGSAALFLEPQHWGDTGRWRTGARLPGCCGLMAAMCVLGMVRSTRRLTACDVVVGMSL